jgi:hypothetical protein
MLGLEWILVYLCNELLITLWFILMILMWIIEVDTSAKLLYLKTEWYMVHSW